MVALLNQSVPASLNNAEDTAPAPTSDQPSPRLFWRGQTMDQMDRLALMGPITAQWQVSLTMAMLPRTWVTSVHPPSR